jgi:hypothetical protein
LRQVRNSDLHFKRGRHAVEGFDALAREFLAMLVQIDKSGRNRKARGVDDAFARERLCGNANNSAIADADIAHGVEAGFGVHDAPAFEDKIVLLDLLRDGKS